MRKVITDQYHNQTLSNWLDPNPIIKRDSLLVASWWQLLRSSVIHRCQNMYLSHWSLQKWIIFFWTMQMMGFNKTSAIVHLLYKMSSPSFWTAALSSSVSDGSSCPCSFISSCSAADCMTVPIKVKINICECVLYHVDVKMLTNL